MATQTFKEMLFADSHQSTYAVLDGASVPDLPQALHQHTPEHVCLYRGELEPDLAECAPYLVRLEPDHAFTKWVLEQGWGNHWGIFCTTASDLRELRSHFRKFLMVYGPDGNPLYFRYYDPRVLRVYLPTCNPEELGVIFGPVGAYLYESIDGANLIRAGISDEASIVLQQFELSPTPVER